jgi:myosin heavy subunit
MDAGIAEGSWVWLADENEIVLPAQVLESFKPGEAAKLKTEDGETHNISAEATKEMVKMDEQILDASIDNLIQLNELNESTILHNLRIRFKNDEIYTFVSSILVAVNPFKMLECYTPELLDSYLDTGTEGKRPHCWSIADNAFRAFTRDGQAQAVVVSGESGAGKTECTKLILQYMAEVSGKVGGGAAGKPEAEADDDEDAEELEGLEQRILQANPVMEAFGNAKTTRNNNSSRFGKLISMNLDKAGGIVGGSVINYLLEKSRVVHQTEAERNYHVFYQLLAGSEADPALKAELGPLLEASEYHYLNQSGLIDIPGVSDKKEFNEMINAMSVLGMPAATQMSIWKITAGILYGGNFEFETQTHATQEDGTKLVENGALPCAAKLWGVDAEALTKSMVAKNIGTRSIILVPYNSEQAAIVRDSLTKEIYAKLFDWLIRDINERLAVGGGVTKSDQFICVLDIFGFESFETNSFEQLCINYCNEKLQFHFNEHIFSMEQNEYKKQGISVEHITYSDNTPCLTLLEASGTGIFAMVDEEINVPKGSDDGFLQKVMSKHGKHDNIERPKAKVVKDSRNCFVVVHYAGPVAYNVLGFLEKNKDALHPDVKAVILDSTNPLLKMIMTPPAPPEDSGGSTPNPRRAMKAKKAATLGTQFKKQLTDLMTTLNTTAPHFIRCVKPNAEKVGDKFTSEMVMSQLRYAGLLEVCRIRQVGFPVRKDFKTFQYLYGVCIQPCPKDIDSLCAALVEKGLLAEGEWAKGKDKIFLRNKQSVVLDKAREGAFSAHVLAIQKSVRRMVYLFKFHRHIKTLRAVDAATEKRDRKDLEHWLNMCGELPWGGHHTAQVKAAKKLMPRMKEEARVLDMLRKAMETRDGAELSAAIAMAETGMDPPLATHLGPEVQAELDSAKKIVSQIEAEREMRQKLAAATAARDATALAELLAQAESMDIGECDELTQARTLRQRLDDEEATIALLTDATESRNLKALGAALSKMTEMGLDGREEMVAGRTLLAALEKEHGARNALKVGVTTGADATALRAALKQAADAGIPADGDEHEASDKELVAKATEAAAKQEAAATALKALKDATEAATGGAEREAQMAALKAALAAVKGAGVDGDPAVAAASARLEQVEEELQAVAALVAAIAAGTAELLGAAISKAEALGLKGPNVDKATEAMGKLGAAAEGAMKLQAAARSRSVPELEAAIAEVEAAGSDGSGVEDAKAALARLKEEVTAMASLESCLAASTQNQPELAAAVAAAMKLALDKHEPELVARAKAALEKLGASLKLEVMLVSAERSRTAAAVEGVAEKAAELGIDADSAPMLMARVTALSAEVEQEQEITVKLSAALTEGKDAEGKQAEIKTLVGQLDEMQRGRSASRMLNNATLREARVLLDRDGMIDATAADMKAAMATGDVHALNTAIDAAIELGMEGEAMEEAKAAAKKLGASGEAAAKLVAVIKTLTIKASDALVLRDLEPLDAAIAAHGGDAETDRALAGAISTRARYAEQVELQDTLAAAISKEIDDEDEEAVNAKVTEINAALSRVRELDVHFEAVDEAYDVLADYDAGFEDANDTYYDDEEDGEEDEAHEKFLEKLEQVANPKYTFDKYPKLRSGDDFAKGTLVNKNKIKAGFLKWQKKIIPKSLQNFDDALSKHSTQLHKALLGYCGERSMSFPASLARNLLQAGQKKETPQLADEIFLLLMKHLTDNPNPVSESCAWHLMCMSVNTFPPTDKFEPYLLNFLGQFKDTSGSIGNYARYSLRRLEGMLKSGPTAFLPSAEDIEMYKERPPVLADVVLVDGNPVAEALPLTPDFDVDRVCFLCAQFVGLPEEALKWFGLFQVMRADEGAVGGVGMLPTSMQAARCDPSPLKGTMFVGDLWVADARGEIPKFDLVFKRKVVLNGEDLEMQELAESNEEVAEGLSAMARLGYLQAQADALSGACPLGSALDVALFAARSVCVEEEVLPDDAEALLDSSELMTYLPECWHARMSEQEWAEAVLAQRAAVEDHSPDDLQAHIMESLSGCQQFGMHVFHVEKETGQAVQVERLPQRLLCAIDLHGMHLVEDSADRHVFMTFPFADIQSWEVHSSYIRFKVRAHCDRAAGFCAAAGAASCSLQLSLPAGLSAHPPPPLPASQVYHEGDEAPADYGQSLAIVEPTFKLKLTTPHSKNIVGLIHAYIGAISDGLPPLEPFAKGPDFVPHELPPPPPPSCGGPGGAPPPPPPPGGAPPPPPSGGPPPPPPSGGPPPPPPSGGPPPPPPS